jgi:serine/threonine protein kinase
MEYLEGKTLRQLLKAEGPQPVERATTLVFQVLSALIAVHECGIVHRDLKPDNVMVVPGDEGEDVVKVLDFGISKVLETEQKLELTRTGSVLGSPRYMSPEQARGLRVDRRTDIYSVGGILFNLLAGRPPLRAPNFTAMVASILRGEIAPPSTYAPSIPEALDKVVLKALERDVEQRFSDARAFRQALRPFATRGMVGELQSGGLEIQLSTSSVAAEAQPLSDYDAVRSGAEVASAPGSSPHGVSASIPLASGDMELATPPPLEPATPPPLSRPAPEELSGSGLIEPALPPGQRLDETLEEATVPSRPVASAAALELEQATEVPSVEASAPPASAPRDDPRELAPGLEPLASTAGQPPAAARSGKSSGGELELDLDDSWRQRQAERHGGGVDPRPPATRGSVYQTRHRWRRLLGLLVPLAILAVLAFAGYRYRGVIQSWFGGAPRAPETILLLVETHPASATVSVDGVAQASRSISLPRSRKIHRIRVSAPGYKPQQLTLRASSTQRLLIRLVKR